MDFQCSVTVAHLSTAHPQLPGRALFLLCMAVVLICLSLFPGRTPWAEAKDHYNQGWFPTKVAAFNASVTRFNERYGADAACATFTELAPQVVFESLYERQTTYTWDINNDGSCPADGYMYVREVICQNGATFSGNGGCIPPWFGDPKNAGQQPNMCENGSNPIDTATGNKYQHETDYIGTAQGFLRFERHYNSSNLAVGEMGAGWTHTYSRSLALSAVTPAVTPPMARIRRPDGKEYRFTWNGVTWTGDPDVIGRLSHTGTLTSVSDVPCPAGGMSYVNEDDETESYNNQCQLTRIATRWGFEQTLSWNLPTSSGGDGNPLTLDRVHTRYIVTGSVNQAITFQRDSVGRISRLITPGGEMYQYAYDSQSRLVSVAYPVPSGSSPTRIYHYENSAFSLALTGITDESAQRYSTYTYDAQGRAHISEHAGTTQRVELTFNSGGTTTVRLPSGQTRVHHVGVQHNSGKVTQIDGGYSAFCGTKESARTYDANGFKDTVY